MRTWRQKNVRSENQGAGKIEIFSEIFGVFPQLLNLERLTNLFGIKVGRPYVSENPARFYAQHTPKQRKRRSLTALRRAGYDAVTSCDSAPNEFKIKNPVIKDRTRENKKNGRDGEI